MIVDPYGLISSKSQATKIIDNRYCMQKEPVRNPLGDKSSADTRKFPAAAFTRMSRLPRLLTVDSTTLLASSCLRTSPSNPNACNGQYTNNRFQNQVQFSEDNMGDYTY